jgi:hypothetical protein
MVQFRKTGSFAAQGDDGRHYLVVHWMEYVDRAGGGPGDPRWEPSGFECLRLEDGRAVRALDGARYEIDDGGDVLLEPIAHASGASATHARAASAALPTEAFPENVFATGGGHARDRSAAAGDGPDPAMTARLMADFGVKRAGRFYVCHGYHYSRVEDAIAYARLQQAALAR